MTDDYHGRRKAMMTILDEMGFKAPPPEGAYYVLADYTGLTIPQAEMNSMDFAVWMVEQVGVAVVPGIVFYSQEGYGDRSVRFAFPKKIATLEAAGELMREKMKA
jgi:aminotransferase